ncbi:type III-A CRISPR-associated RAMP protein Csm3 [Paenibacillus montaniterrae]|uniref:Type III-A CRISPR-associated RAMP protein Csm3 n=1 Tax=Paenibacillus montaniterrae TaxID=429341 RepID=A0A919YU29_9BACL|nr:RAMP superfamily CRISPR-associated protein [Paenibacillus montaniterrae]GIP19710.1 type III-A CRISPR-associated RAMP protein Csm3 [Paenibacillus montaniterrae]
MEQQKIAIRVTTLSNLFIGGSPTTFEIGGVDLYTVTDHVGKPYIPSSSIKGMSRTIVRQEELPGSEEIKEAFKGYLERVKEQNLRRLQEMNISDNEDFKTRRNSMKERFEKELARVSAECLFGIEGFNHSPKLLFNDLQLADIPALMPPSIESYFSIDSKNSIHPDNDQSTAPTVTANPRTYKVVRPGVSFEGNILFYQMDQLNLPITQIKDFVITAIEQFNSGIYRLGNSGSRGYGRIKVEGIQE